MPRQCIGDVPMTAAQRQARARAKRHQQPDTLPGSAAVATLIDLQGEYRAWLDNLPASLEEPRLAEKLQAIAELDLEERQAIDPPRGYGRD